MFYNSEFLQKLDEQINQIAYVKIISLSANDFPREQIEGKVTTGSIAIDGNSIVRRTCQLSLNADKSDTIITPEYWERNSQFKLEIGIQNDVDSNYPNIIWFEMGIYIISSFSYTEAINSCSIQISGKDKMCKLNGEFSGNLPMAVDFGTEEIENKDGTVDVNKIPIKKIISWAIKEYGQERAENIIINDLETFGYELWTYRGDSPLFFLLSATPQPEVISMVPVAETAIPVIIGSDDQEAVVEDVTFLNFEEKGYKYYSFNNLDINYNSNATLIKLNSTSNNQYYLARINYGETAGYRAIPLTYGGDLKLNAGETLTSLLDKLKAQLGNYEYFYDLNGRFIFQRKKTYNQTLFSPFSNEGAYNATMITTPYSYEFNDYKIVSQTNTSLDINNIKNDFTVWGTRKTASGAELPIHLRYAIHQKPVSYTSLPRYDKETGRMLKNSKFYSIQEYDWRELIYQMALDFYAYSEDKDYLIKLQNKNPQFLYGKTGYEQYYSDMLESWRRLYNPEVENEDEFFGSSGYDGKGSGKYWSKQLYTDPESLIFWFDFLDTKGELAKFSINNLGGKTKVVNEKTVTAIYYAQTPEVLFYVSGEQYPTDMSYTPIQVNETDKTLFSKSTQGVSAIEKTNELLDKHIGRNEVITLTNNPIFYLQPNTKIYINGLGDYELTKINYSLSTNKIGMTMTCNKIIKQIN